MRLIDLWNRQRLSPKAKAKLEKLRVAQEAGDDALCQKLVREFFAALDERQKELFISLLSEAMRKR